MILGLLIVALKGAEYLDQLMSSNSLTSEPSKVLDKIYGLTKAPTLTRSDDVKLGTSDKELLIHKDQLTTIATEFKDADISLIGNRAITQITKQLDGEQQTQQTQQTTPTAEVKANDEKKTSVEIKEVESKGKGKEK
jgi:hypothetical protein